MRYGMTEYGADMIQTLVILARSVTSSISRPANILRKSIISQVKKKISTVIQYRTTMKTLMKIKQWIILIICTVICLLSVDNALSQEAEELSTGHAFLGKMIIPNNDPDLEEGDYDIRILCADVQMPFGG